MKVSEETLYEFHKHRMELLWEAGADLLLLETQPSLREALVEAKIAEEMGADYWISFSCGMINTLMRAQRLQSVQEHFPGIPISILI